MTDPKKSSHRSIRDQKKAIVVNAGRKSPITIIIVAAVAVAAAAVLSLPLLTGDRNPAPSATESASANPALNDGRITYAVSLFDDGKARHFQYADAESRTTIGYFILKSTDGVIRAAFDACDVCWRAGKGYYQEGSSMVCLNPYSMRL